MVFRFLAYLVTAMGKVMQRTCSSCLQLVRKSWTGNNIWASTCKMREYETNSEIAGCKKLVNPIYRVRFLNLEFRSVIQD